MQDSKSPLPNKKALALLEWAVRQSEEGRIIVSMSPDHKSYREITMPVLENVKVHFPSSAMKTQS